MAAEIKRFGQEFTSPFTQLAKATLIYKNEIKQNHLTPDTITNYWRTLYKAYGPKSEIQISKPLLVGKTAAQEFLTETKKLDTEVSRFPGTIEEIKEYAKLGMEPVYVSGQLLGPIGMNFLKNLHSGEITIPSLPKIENKNTKGGWRYAQINAQVLNASEAQPMDIPTYMTMAAYMKRIHGSLPDVHNLQDTMSILDGSIIGQKFAEYNNKTTKTAFSFNLRGDMFITPLEGDTKPLNLIDRLQIPIS